MGWAVGWAGAVARRGNCLFSSCYSFFFPQDWEKEERFSHMGVLPSLPVISPDKGGDEGPLSPPA